LKKKILIGCIGAVALLILVSFTSVVGSNMERIDSKNNQISPLFKVRTDQKLNRLSIHESNSNYIGKGKWLHLFPSTEKSLEIWIQKALYLLETNPTMIYVILNKASKLPAVDQILNKNGIDIKDFKNQLNHLNKNPEIIKEELNKIARSHNIQTPDPEPQGLSTSNAIGCFIIAVFALLPLALILGLIIGTITIVTCIMPGCLEAVLQNIWTNMIQGLTPPN
jgi:hypothetical protein